MVWKVKNIGPKAWPANSKLVFVKGNITVNDQLEIPEVQPGDTIEIYATFSANSEGLVQGIWKLVGGSTPFGKFKVKAQAVDVTLEKLEKVKQLMKMGFTAE